MEVRDGYHSFNINYSKHFALCFSLRAHDFMLSCLCCVPDLSSLMKGSLIPSDPASRGKFHPFKSSNSFDTGSYAHPEREHSTVSGVRFPQLPRSRARPRKALPRRGCWFGWSVSRGSGALGLSPGLFGGAVGGHSLERRPPAQELAVLLTAPPAKAFTPAD